VSENAVGFRQVIGIEAVVLRWRTAAEEGSKFSLSKLVPEPFSIDRRERFTAEFLVPRAEKFAILAGQFSRLADLPEPRYSEVIEQFARVPGYVLASSYQKVAGRGRTFEAAGTHTYSGISLIV